MIYCPMSQKGRILVIDDDLTLRTLLSNKFVEHDYAVETAVDGIDGLQRYQVFHPDVIILDIMMPNMDGYTFVEEFERIADVKTTPIIILSSQESLQDIFKMRGINDYIVKPFRMEDLLRKIAKRMKAKHKKILIVDDQNGVLEMLQERLCVSGYEVITAQNGLDGLEKARRERPDLMVVDVMVPKLDGYTLCRMLKFDEKYRRMSIVLLSALARENDADTRQQVKADAFIAKPYDGSILLNTIKELLWD
jgi:DNA-binding response OmpR family regulator